MTIAESFLGKVPPHSIESEVSILGGILLHNDTLDIVAEHITSDDFYVEANRLIYDAMLGLDAIGRPIDLISLTETLKDRGEIDSVGGPSYLASIIDQVPTSANIETYSMIVREKGAVRACLGAALEILQKGYGDYGDAATFLDESEQSIFEATRRREQGRLFTLHQALKDKYEELERLRAHDGAVTGVSTGFADLDRLTTGVQNGDLVIIAGRPGMGKTSFAINLAMNAVLKEKRGGILFSIEMNVSQIMTRVLSSAAGVESRRFRLPRTMTDEDRGNILAVMNAIHSAELYIDDSATMNALEMRSRARYLKSKSDTLGIIIVDYLQIMNAIRRVRGEGSREREIAETTKALKALAKELDMPVVCLSQLNRECEKRQNKRPQLSDLRESGAIEQDADLILFLYRDSVYTGDESDNTAEVIVGKNRNGPTGTVRLRFIKERTSFENLLDEDRTPPEQYGGMLSGKDREPAPF